MPIWSRLADLVPGSHRGGRQHLVHGDDAGAADACEEDVLRGRRRFVYEVGQSWRLRPALRRARLPVSRIG
jgi:hypothetical protein